MKKVIVISTSLRHGSNSDMLADQFVEGAKSAGNEVEKISLVGKNIQFCKGCLGCQKLGRCVINDDVNDIMAKVLKADVICWATPIYYYEMSGQMKTLIDRMNAAGTLFCGGVNDPREIEGNPKLQEAFDLGKNIG